MVLLTLALLLLKHFICDFPLQAFSWMYLNKGTYGHLGGLAHALVHGVGTLIVLLVIRHLYLTPSLSQLSLLVIFDMLMHYHIDWSKMQLNRRLSLTPANEGFWVLLGVDQLLHQLTYLVLVLFIVS